MNKKIVIPIILFISIVLVSNSILAIDFNDKNIFNKKCVPDIKSHSFPDFPKIGSSPFEYLQFTIYGLVWLNETGLMFCAIIPIVGVFLISYGFLTTIRIFRKSWINIGLAILFASSFTQFGPLNFVVAEIFKIMSGWGVLIFAIMFFTGTWLLYKRRQAEWGTQANIANTYMEQTDNVRQQLRAKREEYAELMEKLAKIGRKGPLSPFFLYDNVLGKAHIRKRMQSLEGEIRNLVDTLKEMKEEYET